MELNEIQKQAIRDWVADGCGLAEVQVRLAEEFGISMTYMDVRVLAIDLGLDIRNRPSAPSVVVDATGGLAGGAAGEAPGELPGGPEQPGMVGGAVTVDLDLVTKPGSVVSGTVTFSDGVSASWWLDRVGKLALDAGRPGYSPSQQDLQAFQQELRKALETRGF